MGKFSSIHRGTAMWTNQRAAEGSALWLDGISLVLTTKNIAYIPFWEFWNKTWHVQTYTVSGKEVNNVLTNSEVFFHLNILRYAEQTFKCSLKTAWCSLTSIMTYYRGNWLVRKELHSLSCETNTCPPIPPHTPCISPQMSLHPSQSLSLSLPRHLKPYLDAGRMPTICNRNCNINCQTQLHTHIKFSCPQIFNIHVACPSALCHSSF